MFFRIAATMAAVLFSQGSTLRAQYNPDTLRYTARQLECARFRETARSKILTQTGARDREQTSGRDGVWRFRASADRNGIGLDGWLESLSLWRRSAEATIRPDTDGLLGGRYRGVLSPKGNYSSRVVPFIPDEVAELAGMATALDDFFPPLPTAPLRPGDTWSDSAGVSIRRLRDSALSGVLLPRFEVQVRRERSREAGAADTLPIDLRQSLEERGSFLWHPLLGLIRRERRIVIETTVPAGPAVRQAIRSRIEQQITLTRDLSLPPDSSGQCTGQREPRLRPGPAHRPDSGTRTRIPAGPAPAAPDQ